MGDTRWEHFYHGADIGVRGIGPDRESAFEQAALALTGVIVEPGSLRETVEAGISCSAEGDDWLLYEWLNALVYEMALRKCLFARFQVRIDGDLLNARIWGEPVDPARHQPAVEVKGATLTELRAGPDPSGIWIAQCVVDV